MILEMGFVMLLGLLIFGPKKTLEMSQSVGRSIAHFKRTTSQLQSQIHAEISSLQASPKDPQVSAAVVKPGD